MIFIHGWGATVFCFGLRKPLRLSLSLSLLSTLYYLDGGEEESKSILIIITILFQ